MQKKSWYRCEITFHKINLGKEGQGGTATPVYFKKTKFNNFWKE